MKKMKKYNLPLIALLMVCLSLVSCKSSKTMAYFRNADSIQSSIYNMDYALKIVPADQLKVLISSVVPEATEAFRVGETRYTTTDGSQYMNQSTTLTEEYSLYTVDKNGEIIVPVIGALKVAGLSTLEATALLREKVAEHVQDPIVRVELASFRVNVLGEVKNPGVQTVKTERYTVLDALAGAGDMTMYGMRENVMVIREENGERTFHRLDLRDANSVNSQYFYLRQNDVVYVEPNAVRVVNAEYNQNNSFKISIVSAVISAVSVIASLMISLFINK